MSQMFINDLDMPGSVPGITYPSNDQQSILRGELSLDPEVRKTSYTHEKEGHRITNTSGPVNGLHVLPLRVFKVGYVARRRGNQSHLTARVRMQLHDGDLVHKFARNNITPGNPDRTFERASTTLTNGFKMPARIARLYFCCLFQGSTACMSSS
jgi:hypothetical protein